MGEVWRAWDERLKRRVALKRVQGDHDAMARERFRREAEAGARLSHAAIVQVYDILEDPSGDWLVMELVEGGTLRHRLSEGPLSLREVLLWGREIAEGLAEAHRHGILHRDLKAGNVMLTASGHAKISDFGLAKRIQGSDLEASLSSSGVVLGTVYAMSPEQVLGMPLDARSDLFSLGILLFEMVSGQKPFVGEIAYELMHRICHEPPAVLLSAAQWPAPLLDLIRRLLAKDPADRPADADVVAAELMAMAADMGSDSSRRRARPEPVNLEISTEKQNALKVSKGRSEPSARVPEEPSTRGTASLGPHRNLTLLVLIVLGVAVGMGWWSWSRGQATAGRPSVAVLTFLSGAADPRLDWLESAFPEALSAKLGLGEQVLVKERREVVLAEIDLGSRSKSSWSPAELDRLRRLLVADHAVTGQFTRTGGTTVTLHLNLWDLRSGEKKLELEETGELANWLEIVDRASGALPDSPSALRQALGAPALSSNEVRQLKAMFPAQLEAARGWGEGLARLHRFDSPAAAELFSRAVAIEPHYRISAALAEAEDLLSRPREARAAIAAARAAAGTPALGLPQLELDELALLEARIGGNDEAVVRSEALCRDHFPDDPLRQLAHGGLLLELGKYDELLVFLAELSRFSSLQEHPGLSMMLSKAHYRRGDFAAAQQSAEVSRAQAVALGAVRREALARFGLAVSASELADRSEAALRAREAKEIFERVGDRRSEASCLELAGRLAEKDDLPLAEISFRQAIELYAEAGASKDQAQVFFALAGILMAQGQATESLAALDRSKELAEGSWSDLEKARHLAASGYFRHLSGQLEEARQNYAAASEVFSKVGAAEEYGTMLANQGEIEYTRGNMPEARRYLQQALGQHAESPSGRAYDLMVLGRIQAATGEFEAARQSLAAGLALQKDLGEEIAMAETQLNLAEIELMVQRPREAGALAAEAEEILRRAEERDLWARASAVLSLSRLAEGNTGDAGAALEPIRSLVLTDFRSIHARQIAMAALDLAAGRAAAGLERLEETRAVAEKGGHELHLLEAMILLGNAEKGNGRSRVGSERLKNAATRAEKLGLAPWAQMARR